MQPWCEHWSKRCKQAADRGVKLFFIPGNHDFLVSATFLRASGINLIEESLVIDIDGQSTLLLHGDQLCIHDHSYQRWRSIYRRNWVQRLFLSLPSVLRLHAANAISQSSVSSVKGKTSKDMDAASSAIQQWCKHFNVSQIIHGHTHLPEWSSENGVQRLVLPSWHQGCWVLYYQSKWRLLNLNN